MYISTLNLVNVRCFPTAKMNLSKTINLLVGNNNSGKSTILKSIYKLQNANSLGFEDIRKSHDSMNITIKLDDIQLREFITLAAGEKSQTAMEILQSAGVSFNMSKEKGQETFASEAVFYNSKLIDKMDETGQLNLLGLDNNAIRYPFSPFPENETKGNLIFPFFAKRKINRYGYSSSPKESYIVSEDLRNIVSKIGNLTNSSHVNHELFKKYVHDILGFNIGTIPVGDTLNAGIFIGHTEVISLESMGEGVVNIVGLICLLMSEERKVFLIEEIENDIHPEALKKLLELILSKSKNNQFIISTHSNIVVKYLSTADAKIFGLEWSPSEAETSRTLPTAKIYEVDNKPISKIDLISKLGYDLFDFDLYKSYLIFEESSAETLFNTFLIPTFCPKLMGKMKTISAGGVTNAKAYFHDFLRLFVFIHQNPIYKANAWVIADGDQSGKEELQKLKDKFKSWDPAHFINLSKCNIEEYYPENFSEEFSVINASKDKGDRRKKKILLNDRFRIWLQENHTSAKMHFESNGLELLNILFEIEKHLNKY